MRMRKLSCLLVILGLVTSNIYMTDSYTLTANVLSQLGYNNQTNYINLYNIDIDSIDPNALNGYDRLINFYIFSNSLTELDIEVFKETVNIRSLFIECRSLSKFTNSKNIKLPSVTDFYLTSNLTSFNKPMFNAFPSLNRFSTDNGGGTQTIDVHTFESLTNLTFLYLGHNLLTGFEYLQIPKNLKNLLLGNNNMNYFALSRTMGVLETLDISYNRFRSFKSMDFTFLANLTYLGLSNNPHAYPYEIPGHLKPLVKLQYAELANLSISSIDSNYFKYNTKLWSINLSQNNISTLDNSTFNYVIYLQSLSLSNNKLTKIASGTFNRPYYLIDLSSNQISQIDSESFYGYREYTKISLNNNKLTEIRPRTFIDEFYKINLAYNQISEINNLTFDGVIRIMYLDLSFNKLEKIIQGSFVGKIDTLDLSFNKIESIEEGAFTNAIITDTLSLYGNSLTEINNMMFAGQNQLRTINLSNNKLTKIASGSFANLPNLGGVYLNNNQLIQLDSSIFAGSNNLGTISIRGNPILSTANQTTLQTLLCPSTAPHCHVDFY